MDAAVWNAHLDRAESQYRWRDGKPGKAGWIHWNKYFEDYDGLPQQLTRELHLARKQLGRDLFTKALIAIGPTKTARLRTLKAEKVARMIDRGVVLRPGDSPRGLSDIPLGQFLAMVRLESSERTKEEGGREFRWPESLITRTRALVADWSSIRKAAAGYDRYLVRQDDDRVRMHQIDFLRRLQGVVSQMSAKLARWLEKAKK